MTQFERLKEEYKDKKVDEHALQLLANSWEMFELAHADMLERGMILIGTGNLEGRKMLNPSVKVMNKAMKQIIKMSTELGLWNRPQ